MNIIELAKQAGAYTDCIGEHTLTSDASIEHFAALVRAAALEEAAGVCELRSHRSDDMGAICAAAIRALAEHPAEQESSAAAFINDCIEGRIEHTREMTGYTSQPDDTALLRQALEALEGYEDVHGAYSNAEAAIAALRERLGETK